MSQVTVDANDVLNVALARAAQDYAAKLREIALLEVRLAAVTQENEQLKLQLNERAP